MYIYLFRVTIYLEFPLPKSFEASVVMARTKARILLELPEFVGSILNMLSNAELKVLVPFGSIFQMLSG